VCISSRSLGLPGGRLSDIARRIDPGAVDQAPNKNLARGLDAIRATTPRLSPHPRNLGEKQGAERIAGHRDSARSAQRAKRGAKRRWWVPVVGSRRSDLPAPGAVECPVGGRSGDHHPGGTAERSHLDACIPSQARLRWLRRSACPPSKSKTRADRDCCPEALRARGWARRPAAGQRPWLLVAVAAASSAALVIVSGRSHDRRGGGWCGKHGSFGVDLEDPRAHDAVGDLQ